MMNPNRLWQKPPPPGPWDKPKPQQSVSRLRFYLWIAVLVGGRIVELDTVGAVMKAPQHPYTRALLRAVALGEEGRTAGVPADVESAARSSTQVAGAVSPHRDADAVARLENIGHWHTTEFQFGRFTRT